MNTIKASEIKGVIPEGANYWDTSDTACPFIKNVHHAWFWWDDKKWIEYQIKGREFDDLKEIIYDTEFVPEVGMECEVSWGNHSTWHRCVKLDDNWFSWKHKGLYLTGNPWTHREIMTDTVFRPIKSEEDKLVDLMQTIANSTDEPITREFMAKGLIKAGVKLPEGGQ